MLGKLCASALRAPGTAAEHCQTGPEPQERLPAARMSEEDKKPETAPQETPLVEDDDLFEDFAEDGGFPLVKGAASCTAGATAARWCSSCAGSKPPGQVQKATLAIQHQGPTHACACVDSGLTRARCAAEEPKPGKDTKLPLWTADWDDEDAGQDFADRLKAELQKRQPAKMDTS